MPSPKTPNDFKNLIVGPGSEFCEKYLGTFEAPRTWWEWQAYHYNEDGTFSDAYKADLCGVICDECQASNPLNPNMPAPSGVSATDGTYSDKINVTWNAVTPASGVAAVTEYKLYRSLSTNTDPNSASLVATVSAPTTTYDDPVDGDLILGTTYNYWVVATNGSDTSSFSASDVGNAGAPTVTLPAIFDLRCTKGFFDSTDGNIGVVWTPPAGATHYDVYRHTVNDYALATKIYSDIEPVEEMGYGSSDTPVFYDNDEEVLLYDTPPDPIVKYYYWVIAKKSAPPAVSPVSNTDLGWVKTNYSPFNLTSFTLLRGESAIQGTDFSGLNIRVVLFGGGAGGAGAGVNYGGGGGGGGGVIIEEFLLSAADTISLVAAPNTANTGNAASQVNGADGSTMTFKINGVTKMTAEGGFGGVYSASGSGAGGVGGTGSGTASPLLYPGANGKAAAGANGGRSGYRFGLPRHPAAHYNGYVGFSGNASSNSGTGSGSQADPTSPASAIGGYGMAGYAVIVSGT